MTCEELVKKKNKLIQNAFDSTAIQYILRKNHMKFYKEETNEKKIDELNQFFKMKIKKWQTQIKNKKDHRYILINNIHILIISI